MVTYSKTKDFTEKQLHDLFTSVEWESAKYSDKLVFAMKNSDCVISAWDNDELIGLMSAMSDGVLTVYFHYLLVKPEYQKRKIGKQIIEMMLEEYEKYYRKVLISVKEQVNFYQSCGFTMKDSVPAFITTDYRGE